MGDTEKQVDFMTFVASARWARCRVPHLSPWSRNLNMNLRMHRGIASSPLLRLAAEVRPIGGFAEQGKAMVCMGVNLQLYEALNELNEELAAKIIAEILQGSSELGSVMSESFLDKLHPSVRWSQNMSNINLAQ